MRNILLIIAITLLAAPVAFAQGYDATRDSMAAKIVRYFNDKNCEALYDLTGNKFRAHVAHDAFRDMADSRLFPIGTIQQTDFLKCKAGTCSYKLTFEGALLELVFSLDTAGKLDAFAFKPYKEPVANKPAPVPTSNKMASTLDSQVDAAARAYIQQTNTVGLCVGVLKNGKMTTYGYGTTAKGNGVLPGDNTLFEIASVSKTFTATLLAWYVQEKKVKLTDPITKYLPDSVAANKALQQITLQMLSNHTSGLAPMPENIVGHMTDPQNPYRDYDRALLFTYLKNCVPDPLPGAVYNYSNLAAGLLGVILENVSHKTYEQLVQQIICKPLQMTSTVQHMNDEQKQRFVKVFDEKGEPVPAWELDALAAAGALRSTVHDLLLYAKANLRETKDELSEAMKLTHKITLTKPMKVGLGWHGATIKEQELLWHNGGTYGSSSYVAFVPGRDIAVVVLSNCGERVDEVGKKLLASLLAPSR